MTKHVSINESSNEVKRVSNVAEEEKVNYWVSKEDIDRFKKEFQAEALLSQSRVMVTKVIIGLNQKTLEDEATRHQVDAIMSGGMQNVLQFLAQHGVELTPPSPPGTRTMTPQQAAGEQQVRNMIRQKLISEQPGGVSEEVLGRQIHQIMFMPRVKILEFLQQQQAPPPPPPRFNWIVDCSDYWVDLPPPVQQAAQTLGCTEEMWNSSEQPEESNKAFQYLSDIQKRAVLYLGSTPDQWDTIEQPIMSQDDIMMQKIQELVTAKLQSEHKFPSNEAFQGAIRQVMSLPRDKIKEFLQTPPASASVNEEPLPAEQSNPEGIMMEKIRGLVTYKLQRELNIFGPSDLLESAIDEIMSLSREQIKEYLQKPLLPKNTKLKQFNWVWDSDAQWEDLPSEIKEAAEELGFDEDSWNKTEQPEESDMGWDGLTSKQQDSAAVLGYTKEQWDGVSVEETEEADIASNDDEDAFFSSFLTESKPKGGSHYVPTDDETEFSDSETTERRTSSVDSSSQSSSKQDPFSNKLETFMSLWAFNPQNLTT